MNLNGKVAIITGASSGIGLAAVKVFLAAGCHVMGADISAAPEIKEHQSSFAFTQVDLSKADAAKKLVSATQEKFGKKIDILLNVAGIMDHFTSVATVQDDEWDRVIAVNLTAPTKLMREVIPIMKENKSGCIVNVCSKAGTSGAAAGCAYTASKHGLVGVTKNTAWIFKKEGIRCNAVAPGGVATNITSSTNQSKWDMHSLGHLSPFHALSTNPKTGEGVMAPEVIANAMLFLCSDFSKDINGVVLPVDQGWSAA